MMEKRINQKNVNPRIQVLRGIAIIAVVAIHTCPQNWISQIWIRPFLNFAVALFVFLSGYLTDISKTKNGSFYKKRILKVLIPYVTWTIVYTSIGFISGEINFGRILINLATAGAAATMYYIPVYIQLVILTPLLGKLMNSKYKYLGFMISPLFLIIRYCMSFGVLGPNKTIETLFSLCCLGWISFYYLGLFLHNHMIDFDFRTKKILPLYCVALLFQIGEGYLWWKYGDALNCGTQLKLSAIISSSLFLMLATNYIEKRNAMKRSSKILVMIGNYSFGIYISHLLIKTVLMKMPFWESVPFGVNTIILLVLSVSFVFMAGKVLGGKIGRYFALR